MCGVGWVCRAREAGWPNYGCNKNVQPRWQFGQNCPNNTIRARPVTANPSDQLLLIVPLQLEGRVNAVVEVFQRPHRGPATERGYLAYLVEMSELAERFLKNQEGKWGVVHFRQKSAQDRRARCDLEFLSIVGRQRSLLT